MFGFADGIKKRVSESHIHIGAAGCSPGFYTKTAPHKVLLSRLCKMIFGRNP